ncbi:MAG: hypothetical protein EHM91_17200, partial [Planctomycetota bacterium]
MTSPCPFCVSGCGASAHGLYHGSCGCCGAHRGYPWWPSAPWSHHPDTVPVRYWTPNVENVDPASSPKTIIIGGASPSSLTLEYLPVDGAVAPSVKVTIDGPGLSTTLEDAA